MDNCQYYCLVTFRERRLPQTQTFHHSFLSAYNIIVSRGFIVWRKDQRGAALAVFQADRPAFTAVGTDKVKRRSFLKFAALDTRVQHQ